MTSPGCEMAQTTKPWSDSVRRTRRTRRADYGKELKLGANGSRGLMRAYPPRISAYGI